MLLSRIAEKPPRQVREDGYPGETHDDDGPGDEERIPRELPGRVARQRVENAGELETHECEQERVDDEHEDLPDGHALKPGLDGRQLRRAPAEVDPRRHHGQNT